MTIYQNNDVIITVERANEDESKINCNGANLIWISRTEREKFVEELNDLLDKYRI